MVAHPGTAAQEVGGSPSQFCGWSRCLKTVWKMVVVTNHARGMKNLRILW